MDDRPLVSVILTTRDRPRLFATALACFQHQTYPRRELVVVDDGDVSPVDEETVATLGGRLVRVEPGTPLGTKLNRGVELARGQLCQKMDDDDWYAPGFVETMVRAVLASKSRQYRPVFAFLTPFLFFDVARWEVRQSVNLNIPGATLMFERESWQERPFRNVPQDEDYWFLWDRLRLAVTPVPVDGLTQFLAVRHQGGSSDRGHTWTRQWNGQRLEEYLLDRPLYPGGPEALLPDWAVTFYGELRDELRQAQTGNGRVAVQGRPGGSENRSQALQGLIVELLERPEAVEASALESAIELLRSDSTGAAEVRLALGVLGAAIGARPDLIERDLASRLEPLFTRRWLPPELWTMAAELLKSLVPTPAVRGACDLAVRLLDRAELSTEAHRVLVDVLAMIAVEAREQLDLDAAVALAECEHLASQRERLLGEVVERLALARQSELTEPLYARARRLYAGRGGAYLDNYLSGRPGLDAGVRERLAPGVAANFPLRAEVAERLGRGPVRALVVQNVSDGQGDELIRVVPLVNALLAANPELTVTLVTSRGYLYGHERVKLVSFQDAEAVRRTLEEAFDVVVHCVEASGALPCHSQELWGELEAYVRVRRPYLYLQARTGPSAFVYERVDLDGRALAAQLALDQPRVPNVYEPTLRLLAELGLPIRLGQEPPDPTVLGDLPWPAAERAWAELMSGNRSGRPVAVVGPFGGQHPRKGHLEPTFDELAALLGELIGQGYFLVLLPNGQPWGSADLARRVVDLLDPADQGQIAIAPDPGASAESATIDHHGRRSVPHPSYQIRLQVAFLRWADLVVATEGWVVHAAFLLGRPYRTLLAPASAGADWHPYGQGRDQYAVERVRSGPVGPLAACPPPRLGRARRRAFVLALEGLQGCGAPEALGTIRPLLAYDDPDVKIAAIRALPVVDDAGLDRALIELLDDPLWRVRQAAARALLRRPAAALDRPREHLLAYAYLEEWRPDWARLVELGPAARPVFEAASRSDDFTIRVYAAQLLTELDQSASDGQLAQTEPRVEPRTRSTWRRWLRPIAAATIPERAAADQPRVLILTPLKNAVDYLDGYVRRLRALSYPGGAISLGFLESDSDDGTFEAVQQRLPELRRHFRRAGAWKRDFGYRIPPGLHRSAAVLQVERRSTLARSRNTLLLHALDDEDWVLWLDVDVIEYPPDLIERLLATGREIVQPHCVLEYGGPTFDCNGWRDQGRLHLDDLRQEGELVELDAVGGTVLLVRADLHRDGLIFPAAPYGAGSPRARPGRGELETEGLGLLARDLGYTPWGLPHLEVLHDRR